MSIFSVKTDAFDGPLDLLLHLVTKHEVDIFDVPIAYITEQYLDYMRMLSDSGALDMEALSAFLLLAAELLQIKAQMLLPEEKPENDGTEPEDPRADLAERLLRYKQFKERAEDFAEREKTGIQTIYKDRDQSFDWNMPLPGADFTGVVSIDRLKIIFEDLLRRRERRTDKERASFSQVTRERFTVSEQMAYLSATLKRKKRLRFLELFPDIADKDMVLITFLALLELIRQNTVTAMQENLFGDITLTLK